MYTVSLNIGYESGSSGILNKFPISYQFTTVREFTDFIRKSSIHFADWAVQNYVPKSSIVLYTNIYMVYMEDGEEWTWSWEFDIRMENVREYKPLIMISDEELQSLLRNLKIEDVLNG